MLRSQVKILLKKSTAPEFQDIGVGDFFRNDLGDLFVKTDMSGEPINALNVRTKLTLKIQPITQVELVDVVIEVL